MKLLYEWICMKFLIVKENLSGVNTRMIMSNLIPHIEKMTKVIYSLKSEIHQDADEILGCS